MKESNCKCDVCGKEFYRKPSQIKKNVYCSMLCRNDGMKKYKFEEGKTELEYILQNYIILKEGKILYKKNNKEVKFQLNKGYLSTRIHTGLSKHKDGRKNYKLHRLVAMMFLDDYSKDLQVNHKDGDKTNNNLNNLEMVTAKENIQHSWDELGRVCKSQRGDDGKFLSKDDERYI